MRSKYPGDLSAFHCQKTEMLMIRICISISCKHRVTVTVFGSGLIELEEITEKRNIDEITSATIGWAR